MNPVAFLPVVVTNLHCLFDKVPHSQYMIKFLARVPTLNRPKIISSLAMFTEVVQLLFTDGSCRIEIFFFCYTFCAIAGNCVFAVAIAKRGTLDIQSLRGVRSCHNGARWTSGWNIPLGFLLARNDLSWDEAQPLSQGG